MLDKSGARVKRIEGRAGAVCVRLVAIIRVGLPASVRRSAVEDPQHCNVESCKLHYPPQRRRNVRRGLRIPDDAPSPFPGGKKYRIEASYLP